MNTTQDREAWLACIRDQATISDKSFPIALGLAVFLGWLGADRLYLGYGILGVLKLMTFGACGVWWLIDIGLLIAGMRDAEGRILRGRPVAPTAADAPDDSR